MLNFFVSESVCFNQVSEQSSNKSNTTWVLFIIYLQNLVENDYMFWPLFFLGHHQVVSILYQGKLYYVYSVCICKFNFKSSYL